MESTSTAREITKVEIKVVYEALRDRLINPEGKFDKAGRWYPSADEVACLEDFNVRYPSRAWPYSYMTAARTLKHVKLLAANKPAQFWKHYDKAVAAYARCSVGYVEAIA